MKAFDFDYIIAGAGCAGLSLLINMLRSDCPVPGKILLVEQSPKITNDRTWCFWEQGAGIFEPVVHRSWDRLSFFGGGYSVNKDIHPYRYKMIRGIDFYRHCFDLIRQEDRVVVLYGRVEKCVSDKEGTYIVVDGKTITARYIFNSILPGGQGIFGLPVKGSVGPDAGRKGRRYLLQHFKGWVIETGAPVFNPGEATLMDFRVGQRNGTAFVYTMPLSRSRALVEYTLFSEKLLDSTGYEDGLRDYIGRVLKVEEYSIQEEEFGVIPLTDHRFPVRQNNIIFTGTAGGQTKPSSGYTFQFIQKQSRAIAIALSATGTPYLRFAGARFRYYDRVLLNVLATGKYSGENIFTDLFRNNTIAGLLKFLDNETSFLQELRIIASLPTIPFLRAGLREIFF